MNEKSPFPAILEISFFTLVSCVSLYERISSPKCQLSNDLIYFILISLSKFIFFVEYLESIHMVSADKNGTKCHPVQRPRVH